MARPTRIAPARIIGDEIADSLPPNGRDRLLPVRGVTQYRQGNDRRRQRDGEQPVVRRLLLIKRRESWIALGAVHVLDNGSPEWKEFVVYKTSRRETPFDPTIPERPGWEGMQVHWLADKDHGGTRTTVFNVTEFPPNRWHELHRHPGAEEYFYVLQGSGLHLTEGEPVRLVEGDLVFVPRNEWHGFANDTDAPAVAVTVMGGVAHYGEAGYEVHPAPR